ncbi:hypothetical protein GCM10027034_37650 [Ramlibacter solisilvae]|uniref:Uncharacterized protein n=2 Tax=Ramlibacter tataouinensis TaxID=94132 RepID=A0A127JUS8_9BURK|nr:hypothetical protein UC35_13200 [Ramlibacter tataouinensis]
MEYLASHGYVIVSIARPHESGSYVAADGRLVRMSPRIVGDTPKLNELLADMTRSMHGPVFQERLELGHRVAAELRSVWIGRLASTWTEDQVLVVDRLLNGEVDELAGKLKSEVGYFGMSYGAHISALSALQDARARACVNLDGGVFTSEPIGRELGVPMLCIGEDAHFALTAVGFNVPPATTEAMSATEYAFARADRIAPLHPVYRTTFLRSNHGDVTDWPVLASTPGQTYDPGERAIDLQCRLVGDFFDTFVRRMDVGFPEDTWRAFADALIVHRQQWEESPRSSLELSASHGSKDQAL